MAKTSIKNDFNYLNQLRISAQLKPFIWNSTLSKAANNHAKYLNLNNRQGHHEQKGLQHFTGQWASDRAINSQYPNRLVGENIATKSGEKLLYNPIDSLMSALYHRFGFLDLNMNEVGIGHHLNNTHSFVYVMGSSAISTLCQQPSFEGFGTYSYNICAEETHKIEKKRVDNAKQQHQINNPKIVLWPPKNALNIAPAFYQESPDPLPHHAVSGYPISIQFNPSFYKTPPKLITFKVSTSNLKTPLKAITVMNHDNDPNDKLTAYQHAFFPEHRLEWNTSYTVNVAFINQDNQKQQHITWSFHTQSFKTKIVNITQTFQKIKITAKQSIILYFPPNNAQDSQSDVRTKDYNMQLKMNYIDKNTLKVYVTQQGKAEISFHNKTVELYTQNEDTQ